MRAASPATLAWLRTAIDSPVLAPRRSLSTACLRRINNRQQAPPLLLGSRLYSTSSSATASSPSGGSSSSSNPPPPPPPRRHPEQAHDNSTSYYALFPNTLPSGPPPHGPFTIDLRQLRREFLQLQAQAHPDLAPASERAAAQARSARINEAYRTLQQPLLRAQYLLAQKGVDVAGDEAGTVEDMALLAEVMEVREEIEAAQGEDEVEALRRANEARIDGCVRVLETAFQAGDVGTARDECVKLRYWVNVRETLHAWEKGKRVELVH